MKNLKNNIILKHSTILELSLPSTSLMYQNVGKLFMNFCRLNVKTRYNIFYCFNEESI